MSAEDIDLDKTTLVDTLLRQARRSPPFNGVTSWQTVTRKLLVVAAERIRALETAALT